MATATVKIECAPRLWWRCAGFLGVLMAWGALKCGVPLRVLFSVKVM